MIELILFVCKLFAIIAGLIIAAFVYRKFMLCALSQFHSSVTPSPEPLRSTIRFRYPSPRTTTTTSNNVTGRDTQSAFSGLCANLVDPYVQVSSVSLHTQPSPREVVTSCSSNSLPLWKRRQESVDRESKPNDCVTIELNKQKKNQKKIAHHISLDMSPNSNAPLSSFF